MDEREWLAQRFEEHRTHLRGRLQDARLVQRADDAVQEGQWRLSRSDAGEIENLGGRLTTVVARVSPSIVGARSQPLGLRPGWRGDEPR